MKKAIGLLAMLIVLLLNIAACKKDDNGSNSNLRKVEYKVTASPQTTITGVTYTDENGKDKSVALGRENMWSSGVIIMPITVSKLSISALAPGANQQPAMTLKVQIYVNGALKKEETKVGPDQKGYMIVAASY